MPVSVLCPILAVTWIGLLYVIVTFLGHTNLLSVVLSKKTDLFVCILIIVKTLCDLKSKTDEWVVSKL